MRVFICFHADVFWGGIFTEIPIWLCIVPPPKSGEQYERTAILYHQQYTSKLGVTESASVGC